MKHGWGIREDEVRRAKYRHNVSYLCNISSFDKRDVLGWWKEQPFDLNLDSDILGNCMFCIKRGVNKVALAVKKEPEFAIDFIELVESDVVRKKEDRKVPVTSMYRGGLSLRSIMEANEDTTEAELVQSMRGGKKDNSPCSESCEPLMME